MQPAGSGTSSSRELSTAAAGTAAAAEAAVLSPESMATADCWEGTN
uniref:Uncharacterized protein n=1 Tax=Arundo donax TaxID=35708 RepID=A0A0A9GD24_ARUDO